jgi:protein-tyrosine sulfotransferase
MEAVVQSWLNTTSERQFFILSTPRSGSSLLRYILDTHPMICSPTELNLGRICEYLYWAFYFTTAQIYASNDDERDRFSVGEVRRVVSDLMKSYTKLKSKQIWCEKTPRNLQHLDIINRTFPDAYYICLYRHCMDYAYSCIEGSSKGFMDELWDYVRKRPGNLVYAMIDSWIDQTNQMLRFERENDRKCIRIKYESLVLETVETLDRLFEFLEVEWDRSLLDNVFKVQREMGGGDLKVYFSKEIYKDSVGKGSALPFGLISQELLEKMNTLLSELGYQQVGPDWNNISYSSLLQEKGLSIIKAISGVDHIFSEYIPRQMKRRSDELSGLSGTLKFVVKGDGGEVGVWRIDLTRTPGEILVGDGATDCTIMVLAVDLLRIVDGSLNVGECFLQGRMQLTGDPRLVAKFGQLIFSN